jgi:hypothetical protein
MLQAWWKNQDREERSWSTWWETRMAWNMLEATLRAARVMIWGEKIHEVVIWFLRKIMSKFPRHICKETHQIEVLLRE